MQVLTKALQAHDLEWVGRRRSGLQAAGQIDVGLARRLAFKPPVKGMREAFESVMIGDMVVRRQTRHWQHHDGMCLCGLAQETVDRRTTASGIAPATRSTGGAAAGAAQRPAANCQAVNCCSVSRLCNRSWRFGEPPAGSLLGPGRH